MFEQFDQLVLQREPSLKTFKKSYHIMADREIIGKLEEHDNTARDWFNHIILLTSMHHVPSILMELKDAENNVQAIIKKERGFNQSFQLFLKNGSLVATIEIKDGFHSPKIYIKNGNNNDWLEAAGRNGAIDFSVVTKEDNENVSSISRRSLIYEKVKDNLINDEGYFIDTKTHDPMTAVTLLSLAFIIDFHFFHYNR
ncbi:hypothetical protein F9U64_16375 [Gracilibacillus oryzae]|uniref:Scramblase n=1 Tax=Gracilibacillus oryzae TaxID=1672701 RepID=A0A7C8KNJ8_9BACI|nr:hypothetical protein [Gracilibacillus oryzae]KAB8128273.1 hypothetical protein F9U64_16375 [Gracilibacillus oryzae]